ncbi:hypothetical protein ETAA8_63220 [Anatilimnocola aggregata]|uniref:Uncharacterized protein n=1 Tax=Anatilimnocola aggregata TaxID=2528021 RepID=A0A517YLR7_9BACT|nr:hypothetical protein [Anatilimnocola aggregata]QDU31169.1 hypothetical protein ETAA8_63220 [Anatilimnocola aggregata]
MKRWLGMVLCLLVVGAIAWTWNRGGGRASLLGDAVAGDVPPTEAAPDSLIVHEWGTFTTYSGSDGGKLEFRPLFDDDLPPFVLDRSLGSNPFSKLSYRALVRMETPITYFYTDRPRDVRARVRFPKGLLTEFYPPVAEMSPPPQAGHVDSSAGSSLDWGTIRLIPESHLRPQLADSRLAKVIEQRTSAALPPATDYNNHYAYARQTDSALVHVQRAPDPNRVFVPHGDFFEKFLFYRGLGDFKLPLRVSVDKQGLALVQNHGTDNIGWLMLLDVVDKQVRFTVLAGLQAGQEQTMSLPKEYSDHESMIASLTEALVGTGLYRREAEAMVNTWRSSWFGEQGTRLLYFVPKRLTDELLPLEIEPRPAETVRVLVGRMDVMTPADEQKITKLVQASAKARAKYLEDYHAGVIPPGTPYPIPAEIRQLGRLAEPALARVQHASNNLDLSNEAGALMKGLQAAMEAEAARK